MRMLARLLPFLAVVALALGPVVATAAPPKYETTGKVQIATCPAAGASAAKSLVQGVAYELTVANERTCVCFGPTTCGTDDGVNGICLHPGESRTIAQAYGASLSVSCTSAGGTGVADFTKITLR